MIAGLGAAAVGDAKGEGHVVLPVLRMCVCECVRGWEEVKCCFVIMWPEILQI